MQIKPINCCYTDHCQIIADISKGDSVRTRSVCSPAYDRRRHRRTGSHVRRADWRRGTASRRWCRRGWAGARRAADSGSRRLLARARLRSPSLPRRLRQLWATEADRDATLTMTTTMTAELTSFPRQTLQRCLHAQTSIQRKLTPSTCIHVYLVITNNNGTAYTDRNGMHVPLYTTYDKQKVFLKFI